MKKLIFIITLIFIVLSGFTQNNKINQYDKNGLKIGYWQFNFGDYYYPKFYEGSFKVISIDTTIDYSKDKYYNCFWHKYEINEVHPNIYYSEKKNDFISVPDGKWLISTKKTKTKKNIERIIYYKDGYEYKNEQLEMYPNSSFFKIIENTSYKNSLKTIDIEVDSLRLIFKREIYGTKTSTIYYPTADVQVENAEFDLTTLYTKPDTFYIKFTAKDTLFLTAIKTSFNQLSFINNYSLTPKYLLPGQQDSIGLIFKPDRYKRRNKAVVTIKVNNDYLNFYFRLSSFDICSKNIADVKSIHLKKSDNLILHIEHMFTHNYYALYKDPIKETDLFNVYNCKGSLRCWNSTDTRSSGPLNLSKLKAGTYYLSILCGNIERVNIEIVIVGN